MNIYPALIADLYRPYPLTLVGVDASHGILTHWKSMDIPVFSFLECHKDATISIESTFGIPIEVRGMISWLGYGGL